MEALFIDGTSAKKRKAQLKFQPSKIIVWYEDDAGLKVKVEWKVELIHRVDVRTSGATIRYGDFPHQVLEFESSEHFDQLIQHFPNALFHQSKYNRFSQLGWKGLVGALVGVCVVIFVFFVYGAPFLADIIARKIPREYEESIGYNLKESYLEYLEVDAAKSFEIQQFYDNLNFESPYEISVVVVESDVVNAFALPGGYIVVFSGILDVMDHEGELAALLAHEVSHINKRHSLRMLSRELSMYILFASLTGDMSGVTAVFVENSSMISSLSNSRAFEKEADLEGLKQVVQAGIHPQGMIDLFQKFEHISDSLEREVTQRLAQDTSSFPSPDSSSSWEDQTWEKLTEILSTHPAPKNRINYLTEEIDKLVADRSFIKNDTLEAYFKTLKNSAPMQLKDTLRW